MLDKADKLKLAASQKAALEALEKAGPVGVTTMQGIQAAGTRFPARTHELKNLGYVIKVERVKGDRLEFRYTLLGFSDSKQLRLFEAA